MLYRAFAAQQPGFGQAMAQQADMAAALTHTPNLNISVPVHIDQWQTATTTPLVVFIPADFDEKTYTRPLEAYDKDGQVHLLDAKHAPDYPVVVVGPSERVKGTALTSEYYGPQARKAVSRLLPPDDPNYPGDPTYPPYTPPTGQPYATCRVDRQTDYLRSMWMKDVSVYEEWLLGAPEIRLQILAPTGSNGNGGTIYNGRFSMPRIHIEDT